ncbi:MAG: hypothetical protein ACRDG3_04640 [Tepidiformaceae bacterium]
MPPRQVPAFQGDRSRWHWLLFLPGVLIAGIIAGVVYYEGMGAFSPSAQAAESHPVAWAFVPDAITGFGTSALQICTAEAAIQNAKTPADTARWQEQQVVLEARYDQAARVYDQAVSNAVAEGNPRPADVSPVAPSVDVSKARTCLQQPPVPAPPAVLAAAGGDGSFSIDPADRFLTLDQLDAAAKAAGWPMEDGWWPQMREIIQCETASLDRFAHNTSDPNGGSYGLAQLNGTQHFISSGEDFNQWSDPVVNLRVALWLRTVRGHFGGSGGWMICSERWGIN